MSSDDLNHRDAAVILHDMSGPEKMLHPDTANVSMNVQLSDENMEKDDNIASYIFGEPSWVQDPIDVNSYHWILSLYGPDLDSSLGSNRGVLSDGTGYVFSKNKLNFANFGEVGKFFSNFDRSRVFGYPSHFCCLSNAVTRRNVRIARRLTN